MQKIFVTIIWAYRHFISPFLVPHCRFYPSCSQYALEAIAAHGVAIGLCLTARRVCSCHPFNPGGYDPVPTGRRDHG